MVIYGFDHYPPAGFTNPGEDEVLEFERVDDGRGNLTFPCIGSHSQSEYIQSFAHDCDLETIVRQAELANNPGLLVRDGESGWYGDISSLPDNRLDLAAESDRAASYWAQHAPDLPFDTFDDFVAGRVSTTKFVQTAVSEDLDRDLRIKQNAQNGGNE